MAFQEAIVKDGVFMTLVKLRIDILQNDIAFRFGISIGEVSQIFITGLKLLSKELGVLITWPSKSQLSISKKCTPRHCGIVSLA